MSIRLERPFLPRDRDCQDGDVILSASFLILLLSVLRSGDISVERMGSGRCGRGVCGSSSSGADSN